MTVPKIFLLALPVFLSLSAMADIEALSPAARMEYDIIGKTREEALARVNEPIARLGEKFAAALEKRKAAVQAAGKLDDVVRVEDALKSFAGGELPTGESADPEIAKLGKVYLAERAKLVASLKAPSAVAWTRHRAAVEALVASLTKEGKIEDAKTVREEIPAIDKTIADLTGKATDASFAASEWNGDWELKYDNDNTRSLHLTLEDAKTLRIQVTAGSWEPNISFTAQFDAEKKCFIAEQAAPVGTLRRS